MDLREIGNWVLSKLAEKRAAQRNIDPRLFGLLRLYGRSIYVQGDLHIFLGEKMVPDHLALNFDLRRVRNTMAVIARDGTVKTVVKDARALKKLRRRKLCWRQRNHRARWLH